jgi:hypothetical protein
LNFFNSFDPNPPAEHLKPDAPDNMLSDSPR